MNDESLGQVSATTCRAPGIADRSSAVSVPGEAGAAPAAFSSHRRVAGSPGAAARGDGRGARAAAKGGGLGNRDKRETSARRDGLLSARDRGAGHAAAAR